MTVISITRKATCMDCIFLKEDYLEKRKLHKCRNPKSEKNGNYRRKKDLVCDHWKLFEGQEEKQ